LTIKSDTNLRQLAFIVCTALDRAGLTGILSGGGAATIWSENAYQSRDLDFILSFRSTFVQNSGRVLEELGFSLRDGCYRHPETPFTLEFPRGPLAIGSEQITSWETLKEGDLLLHILTATDCVRDRLAWFLFSNHDYAALEQALHVASKQAIDMAAIEDWCAREGETEKFRVFEHRYQLLKPENP